MTGREETCNVVDASAFVSQTKHFPIEIVPCIPVGEFEDNNDSSEFRDKIQIAIELELFNNAIET
jgi:hypothetical protein